MSLAYFIDADPPSQAEETRRNFENLLSSYGDEADIFAELVQNAIDAILARAKEDDNFVGRLTIILGRRAKNAHYIYVQDNGIGMSPEVVQRVFVPGFSMGKKQGSSIGYKGVGMSYLVGVSNLISLKTVDGQGQATELTLQHTNEWVANPEKPEPTASDQLEGANVVKKLAEELERGTGVYFELHPGSNPSSLSNLVVVGDGEEKEIDNWASYLASRTAVGLAMRQGMSPDSEIEIEVVVDDGTNLNGRVFSRSDYFVSEGTVGYPFPHRVFRTSIDAAEIDATPPEKKYKLHERQHQSVYREWSMEELIDAVGDLEEPEAERLVEHLDWVDGWLCYSTAVFKKVKEVMGTRSDVVGYGARLIIDGVPQGRPMALHLTRDTGLDRQSHVVVCLKDADLDTGRKILADEVLQSAVDKVTQYAVGQLSSYRWALVKRDRAPAALELNKWIQSISERMGNSVLPELFESNQLVPPARVDPYNEQEVIALWTGLLTGGLLSGYEMRALSGFNQYDALVNVTEAAVDSEGLLAVMSSSYKPKDDAVLEFKVTFDQLIDDFREGTKLASEIDLVVCWDCPDLDLPQGFLRPTYGAEWSHKRPVRGASYMYTDETPGVSFPVIALRNVVAEILLAQGNSAGEPHLGVLLHRDEEKSV